MKNILLRFEEVFTKRNFRIAWAHAFGKEKIYKCVAYISDPDPKKDKIVEAFEIKHFSKDMAYDEAYEILKLKYPGKGFDIRISNK